MLESPPRATQRAPRRQTRGRFAAAATSLVAGALVWAGLPTATQAAEELHERRLLLGSEILQRRVGGADAARAWEVGTPHGIADLEDGATLTVHPAVQWSGAESPSGAPLTFPVFLFCSYEPLRFLAAPWLAVGVGGYLSLGRAAELSSGGGVSWLWASRLRAGLRWRLPEALGVPAELRPFAQLEWAQPPLPAARENVFSSWGVGLQLELELPVPPWPLLRMVTHGEGAPEGW